MKKERRLNIFLSVFLGSILISPVAIIGVALATTSTSTTIDPPKTLDNSIDNNTLNSSMQVNAIKTLNSASSVSGEPTDETVSFGASSDGKIPAFDVVFHVKKIMPFSQELLPQKGEK